MISRTKTFPRKKNSRIVSRNDESLAKDFAQDKLQVNFNRVQKVGSKTQLIPKFWRNGCENNYKL